MKVKMDRKEGDETKEDQHRSTVLPPTIKVEHSEQEAYLEPTSFRTN